VWFDDKVELRRRRWEASIETAEHEGVGLREVQNVQAVSLRALVQAS
jgi:hypothetical protein